VRAGVAKPGQRRRSLSHTIVLEGVRSLE
jgi:hypothetical protein